MTFKLTAKDNKILNEVHPDLQRVIRRAAMLTDVPFKVTEGMRTPAQQHENIKKGVSWTMQSRHLTGHAVDVAPYFDVDGDGDIDGKDMYAWPPYYKLAKIIKEAARIEGVAVEWGGDWKNKKDGPHWELSKKKYPSASRGMPPSPKTEKQAQTETVVTAAGGTAGGVMLGVEPVVKAVEVVTDQQGELTSGDMVRIGVAAVIIIVTLWLAFRKR